MRNLAAFFKTKPQDPSEKPGERTRGISLADQSRSLRRYKAIIFGGGLGGFAKLLSLITVAVSVPLTVKYLGTERYGMWMTISSLVAILAFADMGIGSGIVSEVAAATGRDDSDASARLVSSGFFMLVGVALAVSVLVLCSYFFVPWPKIFGVTTEAAAREAGPSFLAFMILFAVGLPIALVQRLQVAVQESWRANLWQALASLTSLIGVILAANSRAGVVWLVLALNGAPLLVGIVNSLIEFGVRRPQLRPQLRRFDLSTSTNLLRSSGVFFLLQLCGLIGTAGDSFIIAQMFGASAVAPYAVVYKLFQASLIVGLFVIPLWPAIGEALTRGDHRWAQSALRRATFLSVVAGGLLAATVMVFGRAIIHVWVGNKITPSLSLVAAFAAWSLLATYGGSLAAFLNNAQFLRVQLRMYGIASIAAMVLKVPLAYVLGPSGVVWATVITYSVGYCIPAGLFIRRYFTAGNSGKPWVG